VSVKELRDVNITQMVEMFLQAGSFDRNRPLSLRLAQDDKSLRIWSVNIVRDSAGRERIAFAEDDGTHREQLVLWTGSAPVRWLGEPGGQAAVSMYGKDRSGNSEAVSIIIPKVLGEGQLPAAKGTLYTAPAGGAHVSFFHIHNTSAVSTETVLLYANLSGTSRIIGRATLLPNESADVLDTGEELKLESGDLLEGVTTNATTVDYTITGQEVST